jgi:hypothetical protein
VATFRELIDEIASDIGARVDNLLDDQIKDAINRAIEDYEEERFTFTEGINTDLNTVVNQPSYALPTDILAIDQVVYVFSTYDYRLQWQTYEWYIEILGNQTSQVGPSQYYTIYAGDIYLYPTPNEVTNVPISGILRQPLTPLTADGDSNGWTNEAKQMIRAYAKMDLFANRLYKADAAQAQKLLGDDQFKHLRRSINRLRVMGTARPFRAW